MARPFLLLLFGVLALQCVSAGRDNIPEDPNNRPPSSPHSHVYSPFIDELPEDISLVNTQPSLTTENRYEPYSFQPYRHRTVRQAWIPPFLFPSEFGVPLNDFNLDEVLFNVYAAEMRNNLKTLMERQKQLIKYVECVSPNQENCQKLPEMDDDNLRTSNFWNWGFGNQYPGFGKMDQFQTEMAALKLVVAKLTIRQNMLYEYVSCSCTEAKECSLSIKPILQTMFANSSKDSREILQNMFSSAETPPGNGFFNNFMSILTQRPNFNWFSTFNPLSSFFGANPFGGTSPWSFPVPFKPITNNSPFGNFWNNLIGYKPSHSSGSVYTSGTGTGGSVTVSSGSPGGPSKPSSEHYTINSPGGTTHVSSSTDGAGGSSVSVVSSSGKSSRNIVYNRLGINDQTFDNLQADPYKIEESVLKLAENGKKQITEGEKFLGVQGLNDRLFRIG